MLQAPVNKLEPFEERIIEFKGLNKRYTVDDGEMSDMKNLSSDDYPCLTQRKPRGNFDKPTECSKPIAMMQKNGKLAILGYDLPRTGVEPKIHFFYDDMKKPVFGDDGCSTNTKMVSINSKICFFPERKYYDVESGESGDLGFLFSTEDNVGANNLPLEYDEEKGEVRIQFYSSWQLGLKEDDVIELEAKVTIDSMEIVYEGDKYIDETHLPRVSSKVKGFGHMSTSTEKCIILEASAFPAIQQALIGVSSPDQVDCRVANLKIERAIPKLDFVCESSNRLWGVSIGDNTIYASKLGDPTNFKYFQGTSMDSYYAEQGSEGDWTGIAPYSNHIMFFKEHSIHKVYGTSPSTYQLTTTQCYGLEKGSENSVAIINDIVIYKSQIGLMAYEGDNPYCITEKFGNLKFDNVVAGTNGLKYYASIHDKNTDESYIMVFDTEMILWHKEDNFKARCFCFYNGKLLMACDKTYGNFVEGNIYVVDADTDLVDEHDIEWEAIFGSFDEFVENKKVYSRLMLRITLEPDTRISFYIKTDNNDWDLISRTVHEHGLALNEVFVPRRCNKFSIKLVGTGRCRIESLTRKFRAASMSSSGVI